MGIIKSCTIKKQIKHGKATIHFSEACLRKCLMITAYENGGYGDKEFKHLFSAHIKFRGFWRINITLLGLFILPGLHKKINIFSA